MNRNHHGDTASSSAPAIKYLQTTENLSVFNDLAAASDWYTTLLIPLASSRKYTLLAAANAAITQTKIGKALEILRKKAVAGDQVAKDNLSTVLDMHLVNGEMGGLNEFETPNNSEVLQVLAYSNFGVANQENQASYKVLVMPHGESKPSAQETFSSYGVGNKTGDALGATHYTEAAVAAATTVTHG